MIRTWYNLKKSKQDQIDLNYKNDWIDQNWGIDQIEWMIQNYWIDWKWFNWSVWFIDQND